MFNLKTKNPGQHIGGILWLQGTIKGYSQASICGLMKISMFELGMNPEGIPSQNNTTYSKDNNMSGMLMPSKRKTTATSSRTLTNGQISAVYSSVWASVTDVFLWLEYNKIPDDVKKSDNCNTIITFCESKAWMKDMSNYKKVDDEKAKGFVTDGRNAFFIRVAIYTSVSIMVVGFLLKKNRTKYRMYYKKLGAFGKLLLTKPTAARRVVRTKTQRAVRRTRTRVRAIRRRYTKK